MHPLKFLFTTQLKRSKFAQKTGGFTLLELLVAMILAALVITPLLGFMINIMDTDRKEQAKINTEQDIKAALDYIAQDLDQAVFIYNDIGLNNPHGDGLASGIKNQIPPTPGTPGCTSTANCAPVLVFWKRTQKPNVVPIHRRTEAAPNCDTNPTKCDDAFVYSLVGYYLIKDDTDPTWSKAARIGRFEITEGVRKPYPASVSDTYFTDAKRKASAGFKLFDLSGAGTLPQKMNRWEKDTASFTDPVNILVDYIDQSPSSAPGLPPRMTTAACENLFTEKDPTTGTIVKVGKLVPSTTPGGINNSSFYACVDSRNTRAQVFIRGNALPRLRNNNIAYSPNDATYFPTATVQVKSRGFLFTK